MRALVLVLFLLPSLVGAQASIRSVSSALNGSVSTHPVTLPATINPADTVVVYLCFDNGNAGAEFGWPGGWTSRTRVNQGTVSIDTAWLEATGSEDGSSINVTTANTDYSSYVAIAYQGAEDPDTQAPEMASATSAGADATVTFGTVTPTGGSDDYLFTSVICSESEAITAFPSGYGSTSQLGAGQSNVGYGVLSATASSETPGNGALNTTDQWVTVLDAIHRGAASGSLLLRRRIDE